MAILHSLSEIIAGINILNLATDNLKDSIRDLNESLETLDDDFLSEISNIQSVVNSSNEQSSAAMDAIGTLSNLNTSAKGNTVAAINEVRTTANNASSAIGTLSSLSTSAKNTLVAAINELVTKNGTQDTAIGTLSSLSTTAKSNLVVAINEILTVANNASNKAGTLSSLTTSTKTSLVAAINELVSNRGTLSGLSTSAKNTLVAAINELVTKNGTQDTSIGTLSSLSTSTKTSLVAAINEVFSNNTTQDEAIAALQALTTNRTIANNAWAHKCIYRGQNLGSTITAAQSAAIRNGTFDDIFIGDYWQTTWRGNPVNFIIVDINYYWHNLQHWQYPAVKQNHVVVYTQGFGWIENAPYKADDDVSGGYIGSDVRNNTIPIITAELADIFGADHLFYHPDYFCNSVNENGESGFVLETQSCVEIPSWAMFYEVSPYLSNPRNYANHSYLPEVFSLPRLTGGAFLCGTNPGHMYFRDCKNASKVVYGGGAPSIWYQDPSKCTIFRPIFTLY